MNKITAITFSAAIICSTQTATALTINFDYSYDTSGFFNPDRSTILEAAGNRITSRINDSLGAINSSGVNQFDPIFSTPDGSGTTTINGANINADTLTIYVGAQSFSGNTLAQAGPGGFSSSRGIDTSRGQGTTLGPTATDFGPWGGSMSFNANTNWYFDTDTSTTEAFSGNDFYSVALHELGHVFGIGTADSWNNQITGSDFTGTSSSALFGANIALNNNSHWANGISYNGQEASMTASITTGTRKDFTELDFAALKDIGWQVTPVPLPPAFFLFASGLLGLIGISRKTRKLRQ